MIVKNESKLIERCLESLVAHISSYAIVDTGSTDDTPNIIRNFFQRHQIPGECLESDWKGFGRSRTEAFELAEKYMTHAHVIDADDFISGDYDPRDFIRLNSEASAFEVQIRSGGGSVHWRRQIFNLDYQWRYVGVVHEYAASNKKGSIVKMPIEYVYNSRTEGFRNQNPLKYLADAHLLLEGLKEEPNNARYKFYLARSYLDANLPDEAIKWFKRRIAAEDWFEEVWYSMYQISTTVYANNPRARARSKKWAWRSLEYCPSRIEAIYWYVFHEEANNHVNHELYATINLVARTNYPKHINLFIQTEVYEWKALYLLWRIAQRTSHHKKVAQTRDRLLTRSIPDEIRAELLSK